MRVRLVLAMFVVMSTLFVPTARAQSDLDAARAEVAEATERLESFLAELEEVQSRGNELAGHYWQAESLLELLDMQIVESEQASEALLGERSSLVDEVRLIAVDRYVSRSHPIQWTDVSSPADRAAAEALADLIVGSDLTVIDRLGALDAEHEFTRNKLNDQRAQQQETVADVLQTQADVAGELEQLAALRVSLDQELTVLEEALADLERAEEERLALVRDEAEQERLAAVRRRAEEAAAAARLRPAPAPTVAVTATPIPNPTPSQPFPTATSIATPIPNPTPSEPFPTPIPDPPGEPLPIPIPNPTPSAPLPTPIPNPPPAPGPGGIVCPLAGPFTHVDDFNSPRAVGGIHRANDLISASGTPVIVVASGMVEHRNSNVGGLSAHLKGDNGDYYFYTHLSGYENVGAGHVAAGTVIGYVGMTGNAPIPHLHFEIHQGGYGNYTNPYGPVKQACGT